MSQKKRRERGSRLEPEQRSFIDQKIKEEKLSVKGAAAKYEVSETSLRNALNGKEQDYETLEEIAKAFQVPNAEELVRERIRVFAIGRERNRYFIGREDKIEAIRAALECSQCAAVTQALSGLGGMGKTATAIEYAYRCLNKADYPDYPSYRAIQFVCADTADVLKEGYADMAGALRLPLTDPNNREEAVRAVLQWMTQPERGPWLLILDNLDEGPELLKEFLPKAPQRHFGHVLITSRLHRFGNRIERVDIEAMDEEEGVTFLYRRTGRTQVPGSKEEEAAKALVAAVGGLPLALEQAGAYMTSEIEMSIEDYLTGFRSEKRRSEQLDYAPEYGAYVGTVRTTWRMSLERIKRRCPEAVDLLHLCAFLHPAGVPRELVFALLPAYFAPAGDNVVEQNDLYNRLLTVLTDYSLIQRDLNNNTHGMNVLVQTVLRDEQSSEEQERAYERILAAIAGSFPSADYLLGGKGALYYPHAERLRNYVEQSDREDELVALLLNHIGLLLHLQGCIVQAEAPLQKSLAIRQNTLPNNHPDLAESIHDMGVLYWNQGRYAEADPLLQKALAIRREALPECHPDIALTLYYLGVLYCNLGRGSDAEPLLQKSLDPMKCLHRTRM
jgi:tetratricopeptide (TPR) repeat protein